jgi:hypothetical protein
MLLINTLQWVKSALIFKFAHPQTNNRASNRIPRRIIVEMNPQKNVPPVKNYHDGRHSFFSSMAGKQLAADNHLISPDYPVRTDKFQGTNKAPGYESVSDVKEK